MKTFNLPPHWLNRWAPTLESKQILELGSGAALDARVLVKATDGLVCSDIRRDRWQIERQSTDELMSIPFVQSDHQRGLPFASGCFDIVVAGLSLHYFDRADTFRILDEIQRVLKPNGQLIARVNSVHDYLHGAGSGEQLEPGYFYVTDSHHAQFKRFFTPENVAEFLQDWSITYLEETRFEYYGNEKVALEFVAHR